jgi:hypothetical protein
MEQQHDFDFIDEQSLSSIMTIDNGSMKNLSGTSYLSIIIPPVTVMPRAVIAKLQQFASSGEKVIFIGKVPSLMTDRTFLEASKPEDPAWAIKEPSGRISPSVLELLPKPD